MEIPIDSDNVIEEASAGKTDSPENDESAANEQVVDVGPTETEEADVITEKQPDYLDQLKRLKAEFDNYRKRNEREKEEFFTFAKGRVIQKFLPVLDDLERMVLYSRGSAKAKPHEKADHKNLAKGIDLIRQKTRAILLGEGLEEIDPKGKPFDPEFHEAVGMVDTDPEQDGKVVEELERGYLLQGKLLRPSRVRVGKAKAE